MGYKVKKMTKIINKTPHQIRVRKEGWNGWWDVVFEPNEPPIRLKEKYDKVGEIEHIPVFVKKFLIAEDTPLPPQQEGVVYIVSLVVAQTFPNRRDFVIPNDLIRDTEGRITGCKSFARVGHNEK